MNDPKQGRAWMITINNPHITIKHDLFESYGCDYAIWQLEKGENGTEHIQAYVYWKKPVRFAKVKEVFPRAHIEPRRGTHEEAKAYCSKTETRLEGPWMKGEEPSQVRLIRDDMLDTLDEICIYINECNHILQDEKKGKSPYNEHYDLY